jgi:hypothetical protein
VGGDHLYVFSFATNGWESFELGTVESKDAATGKVRLKDIAAGITTGTPYLVAIARPMRLLTSFMMGNSTAGSNVIGNVYSENNTLLDWSGFTIVSPHFPAGTYIVSTDANAKTFTMSNKATATVNGMEVIWADWNAVEYGTEPFSYQNGYGYSGYRQGDVIYNNDPIKYPDVEKRVCVKSGLLGWPVPSPYVPEFTTYYKEVSSAFKPTSNTTTGSTITNGQMVVSKGRFIQNIVVSSDKALSVQIGTTLGGSDILANTSITANTVNRVLTVNKFCTVGSATTTTLYVRFTQTNTPPTAVTANVNLTVMR